MLRVYRVPRLLIIVQLCAMLYLFLQKYPTNNGSVEIVRVAIHIQYEKRT
jgi:hypothetical protein